MFFQKSVEYLGHQIDETGVHTSPQNVKAVVEAPSPRNLRELRSFLRLLNYYACFLHNLASTLHPLHQLLQAGQPWCWSEACDRAFRTAKLRNWLKPLVYGVRKFHQYLYGYQFTILKDHKPLKAILGPKKHIPPLVVARMQHWLYCYQPMCTTLSSIPQGHMQMLMGCRDY